VNLEDIHGEKLLVAEQMVFRFGLGSLFQSTRTIPEVVLTKGRILIHMDKDGVGNFNIVEKSSEGQKDFTLALNNAILQDIELVYQDARGPHELKFLIEDGEVAGVFTAEQFDVDLDAQIISRFINLNEHQYLVNKPAQFTAQMGIDLVQRKYTFKKAQMNIDGNPLRLGGFVQATEEATVLDLKTMTRGGDIATMISFLPEQYTKYIDDFHSDGNFDMVARIKGPMSDKSNPAIEVIFGLDNAVIKSKRFGESIKKVNFKGKFNNGKERRNKTSVLSVQDFKGRFHGEPLAFDFKIKNLDTPSVDFELDGKIGTADVIELIDSDYLSEGKGYLKIRNFAMRGLLKDLIDPVKMSQAGASGQLSFNNVGFNWNEELIKIGNGKLNLKGNRLALDQINISAPGTACSLSGKCYNLIPMLMSGPDDKKVQLQFEGNLDAAKMDVKQLVGLFEKSEADKKLPNGDSENDSYVLTPFLQGTFAANISDFSYGDIKGEKFKGSLDIEDNEIALEGNALAMGGKWLLDGTVFLEEKIIAESRLSCQNIDVKTFFEQANNFGQEVIRAEHLNGKLVGNFGIDAYWDKSGNFLLDDLKVLGDVAIANGELKNMEMLYDFSKYIKIQDLRHVRFTTLRNLLEVKNKKIYIPSMFVQSNAVNLELCGTHSFDNKIDYNFKVNAGQVVTQKLKKHNKNLVPLRAQKAGLFNMHFRVYGYVDKFQVKTDNRHVKKKLANSQKSKIRIQNKLAQDFGRLNIPNENWKMIEPTVDVETAIAETSMPADIPDQIDPVAPTTGSADAISEDKEGFRLEDLINKNRPKPAEKKPLEPYVPDEEEEFLDFEIEGTVKPKAKSGGNN